MVCVIEASIITDSGILIVAVQVYSPPSDVLNGVKSCITELVLLNDSIVELENIIFMSGNTIKPSTTLAVQFSVYSSPAVEVPENDISTLGAGRSIDGIQSIKSSLYSLVYH